MEADMPNTKALPKLFKSAHRYSGMRSDRPIIGSTVYFSHALILTQNELVPKARDFKDKHVFNGAEAVVISNSIHFVEIRFTGSKKIDLISPEFLTTSELTKAGEKFFANIPLAKRAQTRSIMLKLQGVEANERQ